MTTRHRLILISLQTARRDAGVAFDRRLRVVELELLEGDESPRPFILPCIWVLIEVKGLRRDVACFACQRPSAKVATVVIG